MQIKDCQCVFLMLSCFASVSPCAGQATVVSPGGQTVLEGSESAQTPDSQYRIQYVYPAEDFSTLPDGGAFITGVALRADESESDEVTTVFDDVRITLSTFSNERLSSEFATNFGDDAAVVFDQSVTSTYPADGPPGGPNPFGTPLLFDTPFFYDPSLGDLLVEEASASGSNLDGHAKDWESTNSTTVTWTLEGKDAAFGSNSDRFLIVRQFTFVPEPSTAILSCLGFLSLLAWRRKV